MSRPSLRLVIEQRIVALLAILGSASEARGLAAVGSSEGRLETRDGDVGARGRDVALPGWPVVAVRRTSRWSPISIVVNM